VWHDLDKSLYFAPYRDPGPFLVRIELSPPCALLPMVGLNCMRPVGLRRRNCEIERVRLGDFQHGWLGKTKNRLNACRVRHSGRDRHMIELTVDPRPIAGWEGRRSRKLGLRPSRGANSRFAGPAVPYKRGRIGPCPSCASARVGIRGLPPPALLSVGAVGIGRGYRRGGSLLPRRARCPPMLHVLGFGCRSRVGELVEECRSKCRIHSAEEPPRLESRGAPDQRAPGG